MMKRLLLVVGALLLFSGCAGHSARESGFFEHDSMYRNWEHMKFSIFGYQSPTDETLKKSEKQDWWGIPVDGETE